MKRVVALLMIASVVLFAAVAPKSSLKNAGVPMPKMSTAEIKAAPLQMDDADVRTNSITMLKAPALSVDTTSVTIVYLEDFENGANGWTQHDGTAPDPDGEFVLTDELNPGDSSWWCGANIGGYLSHWHVALETPAIVMAGPDSILSFYMEMNAEDPGVSGAYDGWDGGNVQISNDGGETWLVLTPEGIPYNATSMYSFGYEFNMGPGIPGWGGIFSGDVTVNLAEYIGDTVQVRFVFASDPAYDYLDDDDLTGMVIDSIDVAGNATYNGSVKDGLISKPLNSASGSYWAVEDRTDTIPSPTHALRNWVDGDTTYARMLEDYYVSPSITLPDEAATFIYCNFEFWSDFEDETGEFPDVDYWRLEVSPDDGVTWNAISNPTGSSSGKNYVYDQRIPAWYDFQYAYGESCDLTIFAGQTVKFRFYFHSDDDKPIGQGLLIDDFVVYTMPDLPSPIDITASLNDGKVDVSWKDMNGTYDLPKTFLATDISDCGGFNASGYTFFGDESGVGYGIGQDYSTDGKDLTIETIHFALPNINPYNDSVSIVLYGIDTSSHVLYDSGVFLPNAVDNMQTIDLSSAPIVWNGNLRLMLFTETSPFYPGIYMNLDNNQGMKLYRPSVGFYSTDYSTPLGISGYTQVTYAGLTYNVYRRVTSEAVPKQIANNLSGNTFTDEDANSFTEYVYTVSCATEAFEGSVGQGASIFVIPSDVEEAKYDDGIVDNFFELGMDTTVVIKITPTAYPAKLEAIRFNSYFAEDVYKVKLYKDENGMPGDSWLLIEPPVTAIEGWNTFKIINPLTADNRNGVVLRDGESVWIGVKGATAGVYPAWLAADMDSFSGMSAMQVPGGNWASTAPYLMGNPMIRGYFDTDIDTTSIADVAIPSEYALAQNYPNPFNPVTTIHFELKNSDMTKLDIFDVTGRHVRTLLNGSVDAGSYDLRFDASALSSGIYFYRLTSGSFTDIKKMSLLK